MRPHLLALSLLTACTSTTPRPEPARPAPTLPRPLVDARDFVGGRLVAAPGGWRFEGEARSGVVPWPTGPARPGCYTPTERFAWPIEGTTRLLVLEAEPLVVEERDGCLVATPLRTARAELGRRALTLPPDAPPEVRLFDAAAKASAGDLADLTLTFEEQGLPWLALGAAKVKLEPDGAELDEEDELRCWEPEAGEEVDLGTEPRVRKAELVWRGATMIEELELAITQTCGGDPSDQGGAVAFERTTRWILERDPASAGGWRQAHLAVSARQSSGGDGAVIDERKRQSVVRWSAGEATLIGQQASSEREDETNYGGGRASDAREGWWIVPTAELGRGLDAIDVAARGLPLTPDLAPTERDAELQRALTAPGTVALGPCVASFEGTTCALTCGGHRDSVELFEEEGTSSLALKRWDLGHALMVELELSREHRFTAPDDASYERTSQESQGARFLVSKRSGAISKTGAWRSSLSL